MMIEIQKPELQALIQERMLAGAFQSVEDALMQALQSAPLPGKKEPGKNTGAPPAMGTELVAAMQASPFKEICLEAGSERSPVREVAL